jgi:uncharacterized membrane protein
MPFIYTLLTGVVAGSRAMMAPAAAAWFARLGLLDVSGTWLAFMASPWTVGIFTVLALVELVTDQLPTTPSRTVPVQFTARMISGALSGAAVGTEGGSWPTGLFIGIVGAVIGTFGGRLVRGRLAAKFNNDHPAAFIEDALAIALVLGVSFGLR